MFIIMNRTYILLWDDSKQSLVVTTGMCVCVYIDRGSRPPNKTVGIRGPTAVGEPRKRPPRLQGTAVQTLHVE